MTESVFTPLFPQLVESSLKSMTDFFRLTTTIYLVRHGQAEKIDLSSKKLFLDYDPPLSFLGQKQALVAAEKLTTVDEILTSPSCRTVQTASIIAKKLKKPLTVVYDVHDCKFATYWPKNKIKSILTTDQPEETFKRNFVNDLSFFFSYCCQTVAGIIRIVLDYQGKIICLVTHGEAIETIVNLFKRNLKPDIEPSPIYLNCSVTKINLIFLNLTLNKQKLSISISPV